MHTGQMVLLVLGLFLAGGGLLWAAIKGTGSRRIGAVSGSRRIGKGQTNNLVGLGLGANAGTGKKESSRSGDEEGGPFCLF